MKQVETFNGRDQFTPTERTDVRRLPQRGSYEREVVYRILDEGLVCHVGFVVEGQPFVIPTGYGRAGDTLYLHGARASRMMKSLAGGREVCVTITLLDGLVLARSAFHHSMNYRSVVVFGRAHEVTDRVEKTEALRLFTEHMVPGRWADVRPPTAAELNGTTVLALPLAEGSAKIRTGPPVGEEDDFHLPHWAGELPLHTVACRLIPDPQLRVGVQEPSYLEGYDRARIAASRAKE
ncbi:MAG: pyridoxamine 5'-phosphate oxidase family protein [Pyrinomonadaceae bacterium]